MPAPLSHDAKVQQLVDQIRARRGAGSPVRFRKSSVSHFVPNPIAERLPGRGIDVQPLDRLLSIDPEARVAVAEPGLTFAELLAATLPHGLMPTCVPELRGITVGGAVSGCSVEPMSYKHGGFSDGYAREIDFWPLWIVPYRMPEPYPWISEEWRSRIGELVIACAVYGKPNNDPQVDWSAELERQVFELSGIKTLISRNHYDEETFWTVYHRAGWEGVKARTDPENLSGHLYRKMHPPERGAR